MRSLSALPVSLLALAATTTATALSTTTKPDGLRIELESGPVTCTRPTRTGDTLVVNYQGTLESTGEVFDESYSGGKPFTFKIGAGRVIQGWDEGLLDMCIGQTRKLTIPSDLAYGEHGVGKIPPGATLVFVTHLEDILYLTPEDMQLVNADSEKAEAAAKASSGATATVEDEGTFSIATAPASPPDEIAEEVEFGLDGEKAAGSPEEEATKPKKECQLLGPFALFVQGLLGALALLTLVWKRWRETPKRPWKIFLFDVSKQVFGSMLTHVINLAISMLSSVDMANAAAQVVHKAGEASDGRTPNPCSFYLLNLAIDTTIGVPVLWIFLKVLYNLFLRTPLANPPQSIQSGNYGHPPSVRWYGKQLLIYCIGLVLMKFCVLCLFLALPWLPWIGDWALRWTRGNEALEITFALFIFPLAMNAIQYWVIDNFIMDRGAKEGKKGAGAEDSGQAYTAVAGEDDEEEHRRMIMEGDSEGEEDEEDVGRNSRDAAKRK